MRSDEAVYSTPLPLSPPPPHRTTFTLAVWPPKVYSRRRVAIAHTFTVPSLEEDASRGDVGFLIRVSQPVGNDKTAAHMCIGSQDRDVIHFEWPFRASPIGFPVLGSHIRTCGCERATLGHVLSAGLHGHHALPSPAFVQGPPTRRIRPTPCGQRACAKEFL